MSSPSFDLQTKLQTPALTNDEGLGRAIRATLSYYDLLRLPLTSTDMWRFLLRPQGTACITPSLRDIDGALRALAAEGTVSFHAGYYALPGHEDWIPARRRSHVLAQEKWHTLRRIARWLQAVPFVHMLAASGSLARDHVHAESDLDVLVGTTPGRIWTARFFLTLLLDATGVRRRPTGPTTNRVCLNHYLALDHLQLPYHSVYTACEYARLVPLINEQACWQFRAANREWMEQYLVQVIPDVAPHQKCIPPSPALHAIQSMLEFPLRGWLGNMVEHQLKQLQESRIAQHAESGMSAGRVVATDVHLEFHPHSHEAPLLEAFNARMDDLGLTEFGRQQDSGLSLT